MLSTIYFQVIEMELLQLDLTYVRSQLDMTGKFLPEAFYQHGQDGDGIQVVLLFPNLVQKLRLLSSQVRSKVKYYVVIPWHVVCCTHILLIEKFHTNIQVWQP